MSKRLTVFYSWQSDTPGNLNRSFIESAIKEALKRLRSDAKLEEALRDSDLELDKDTKGVPGSPPIAETIFKKIEACTIFIADVTFVGASLPGLTKPDGKPRFVSNPNVMLEYGYALRCHSHNAIVSVMNTAYGVPSAEALPFDLRHLRWPITYRLTKDSKDKSDQLAKLIQTLTEALGTILAARPLELGTQTRFSPHPQGTSPAVFFDSPEGLFHIDGYSAPRPKAMPDGAKAYLRLYPEFVVVEIESELRARDLAVKGNLQPMGRWDQSSYDRNILGAIVYCCSGQWQLGYMTQLFMTREIWGVDACVLNEVNQRQQGSLVMANPIIRYIPIDYVEEYFVRALSNYLFFARNHLKLVSPLVVEAGLTGIRGYTIATRPGGICGGALRDILQWKGEAHYNVRPSEILGRFFDLIWENCGIQRDSQHASAFADKCQRLELQY